MNISILLGDITKQTVDAIVNAANTSLLGGGGVDGAIHKAAGKELLAECRKLSGCKTGEAKITKGYCLPAKYIIHTAGPVYSGGHQNEEMLLFNCYINSMKLAEEYHVKSIAFPCISTGIYGYPFDEACQIALNALLSLKDNTSVSDVFLVCYSKEDYNQYQEIFKKHIKN
ncbi:MAG: O-acetyl-ADP-ribose deacetylase [Lachnospiraceae bacterium]|nr:O-acetyl-ADP-ribose deacetylase [Lachnospiraceae bacterium]